MTQYSTAMDQLFAKIERDLKLLIWMAGCNLAASMGVIFILLCH